jgi:uncharacterized protein YbbK (DUF523 family)
MRVCVSACLLGVPCRYSGRGRFREDVAKLCDRIKRGGGTVIEVCPEVAGGLPVPRVPSERQGERVVTRDGRDVTAEYRRGAECAVKLAERFGARHALLKARSPSCGPGPIYDGSFTGKLTEKNGMTAEYLGIINLSVHDNSASLLLGITG